ncbi:MAG: cyclic pyranopterin monophosphate synthase MoaC [Myxococcales bacterium]|nr:cyclic pyranopterin monophosphate synthase MoaC [Myxococcales bacterium]
MSETKGLTHLSEAGEVHMVDVGEKAISRRRAVASAQVLMRPETVALARGGGLAKGDLEATVRVAAIMAAKETPRLIPLCHSLGLTAVEVQLRWHLSGAEVEVAVETYAKTGVEMEAMVAASVGALTLYDMVKGVERGVSITAVALQEKSGGRSGLWRREGSP